jgi:[acyl-carrier-protein] S-malonyltransferase
MGMGRDLYERYPVARNIFDRADGILGYSLSGLCFEGPERQLNHDLVAQLAAFTMGCALTEVLKQENFRPGITSGYSAGFYTAAYAAGCFDFDTGLVIVKRAGELLLDETSRTKGCMAVIFGLPRECVEEICRQSGGSEIAIVNTDRQIIISGTETATKKAMAIALKEGALDAYILPVAAPYHSSAMATAGSLFLQELGTVKLQKPAIPLFSYHTLQRISGEASLKMIMATQLSHPMLWIDLIKTIHRPGMLFIELGADKVIARTVRWIDRDINMVSISDTRDMLQLKERLQEAL